MHHLPHQPHDDHDKSLPEILADLQLQQRLSRRAALRRLGGAGLILSPLGAMAAVGCGEAVDGETIFSGTSVSTCTLIPSETNGPYPADGANASSQTLNVLAQSGIIRQDVRSSFGSASATAPGVPMTLNLTIVNTNATCAALSGYAVYIWHCTATGLYSMYSSGITGENYLRGVQITNSSGQVTFTTIFPGCYNGRWPHIHFEIYRSAASVTAGNTSANSANLAKISQLGFTEAECRTVYADSRYTGSTSALNNITLASDNVFSDGYASQIVQPTGSIASGYTANLTVGVTA